MPIVTRAAPSLPSVLKPHFVHAAVFACALSPFLGCKPKAQDTTLRVAAASDVTGAFEEMGRVFQQNTGQNIVFSFASSGVLAKQIQQGAPFDVFASANRSYAQDVIQSGRCEAQTLAPYAMGRLSVWTPNAVAKPIRLEDLKNDRFSRIAIANPEHAPYGKAAKEALISIHIWESIERRIVFAENVRQALQMAESGNVEAAVVSHSLVHHRQDGAQLDVDYHLHAPIEQSLVVCGGGSNRVAGLAFAAFVNTPTGREIMERHGFSPPSPAPAAP